MVRRTLGVCVCMCPARIAIAYWLLGVVAKGEGDEEAVAAAAAASYRFNRDYRPINQNIQHVIKGYPFKGEWDREREKRVTERDAAERGSIICYFFISGRCFNKKIIVVVERYRRRVASSGRWRDRRTSLLSHGSAWLGKGGEDGRLTKRIW